MNMKWFIYMNCLNEPVHKNYIKKSNVYFSATLIVFGKSNLLLESIEAQYLEYA